LLFNNFNNEKNVKEKKEKEKVYRLTYEITKSTYEQLQAKVAEFNFPSMIEFMRSAIRNWQPTRNKPVLRKKVATPAIPTNPPCKTARSGKIPISSN